MTDQNPPTDAPSPAPEGDQPQGTPHVEPAPELEVPKGAKDTGRFSAYDKTYGKYVGGVHDSREKARKAAKDAGADNVEIVEV